MSRRLLLGAFVALSLTAPGLAQEPANLDAPQAMDDEASRRAPLWSSPQQGEPSMTSNVWLYLHEERRHDDPQQAIRRKAEAKATARGQRIAALQWYGLSNQRPTASSVPFMGTYSPSWLEGASRPATWAAIYRRPFLTPITDGPDARR